MISQDKITEENLKILIVGNNDSDINMVYEALKSDYKNVEKTTSYKEALTLIENQDFKIILSDQNLSGCDGVVFLENTAKISPNSIRVLITEGADSQTLLDAINKAKIYRYIKKPCNLQELKLVMNSISNYISLKAENDKLIVDLKNLFTGTINAITVALDGKNPYIFGKSRRVAFCAIKLARYLGLSEEEIGKIDLAGLLHDIGMIGIPERVLGKVGKFTLEEKTILKEHVKNGINILQDIKQLKDVLEIIKYHHEQYDGNGYPFGLKGEEIPLGSRIIAVSDAYDGLISDRAYRKGYSPEEGLKLLKQREGLDPYLVDKFIEVMKDSLEELKNLKQN